MTDELTYSCSRCGVSKTREHYAGRKKRVSRCKDCEREVRQEKKDAAPKTKLTVKEVADDWSVANVNCHCGKPVIYITYSTVECDNCGRVYACPQAHALKRRATEEEKEAARVRSR